MTQFNRYHDQSPGTYFQRLPWLLYLVIAGVFALGLGLRLINLTNPPLDGGVRTLRSLIVARGMYYQMLPSSDPVLRERAVTLWQGSEVLEPPIFERMVAITYLLIGQEVVWLSRLFSILFWMVGGLALYALARKMTTSDGAVVALAYYLIADLGIIISRKFQPDPFMVMWILLTIYALYNWVESHSWKSTIIAGLLGGIAILVKVTSVFFIASAGIALVLSSRPLSQILRSLQTWIITLLMAAIPFGYYLISIQSRSAGYFLFWNISFAHLLKEPWFYVRWIANIDNLIGLLPVFIGLAGILILPPRGRSLMSGLWIGYVLFGLAFPYQIHTHDYYNLILVPLVALSIAPIGADFFSRLTQQPAAWQILFLGIALLALAAPAWNIRTDLIADDWRGEWKSWTKLGSELPKDGNMIALTHEYGTRIEYFGWRNVGTWPVQEDFDLMRVREGNVEFDYTKYFNERIVNQDYFLITLFGEFETQSQLKDLLYNQYPIYADGDGYLIFDLRHPLRANP